MIKVTIEQVITFRANAMNYKRPYGGRFSPFLICLEKALKETKDVADMYDDESREVNMKYAEKDKEGFYLMDDKDRYRIKGDNEVKRDADIRELLKKEVEVKDFIMEDYIKDLPKDIDFSWWNVLSPFVLPPLDDKIIEELYKLDEERNPKKK